MRMGRGFLLGALGCLAIGISGGEAVAETPSQADIAGQLMPTGATKNQMPCRPSDVATARQNRMPLTPVTSTRGSAWAAAQGRQGIPLPPAAVAPRRLLPLPAAKPPSPPKIGLDTIQFEFNSDPVQTRGHRDAAQPLGRR